MAGPATFVRRLLEDLETAIAGRIDRTYESTDVLEALRKCRKQIDAGLQRARWRKSGESAPAGRPYAGGRRRLTPPR